MVDDHNNKEIQNDIGINSNFSGLIEVFPKICKTNNTVSENNDNLEKQSSSNTNIQNSVEDIISDCLELGFKKGTDKLKNCVLQLSK